MPIKEYDLICSLGGNCSAANALRYRRKRYFSLPFDWCYMVDDKPLKILSDCIRNSTLEQIAQKENLVLLSAEEEADVNGHSDTIHYKDTYSGYYYVNHFHKTLENGGYNEFRKKFDKRLKRLNEYIAKSDSILFILGLAFEIPNNSIITLQKVLTEKYPNKKIDFEIIEFNCKEESIIQENPNLKISKYIRCINNYDFTKTNYEWAFMDDVFVTYKFRKKLPLFQKLLIKLCPFKNLRKELKNIYFEKRLK